MKNYSGFGRVAVSTGGHSDMENMHIMGWSAWMRAGGAPETTIRTWSSHLQRVAAAVGLPCERDELLRWLGRQRWSAHTRKSARSALRSWWRWAVAEGVTAEDVGASLPSIRIPRAIARPTPEQAVQDAIKLATLSRDDVAIKALRLAAQCGLRRDEVARVRAEDVQRDLLGWSLHVVGKGGHVRQVPLPDDLASMLRQGEGWAFPSPVRPGMPRTADNIAKRVTDWLPVGWSMHTLRHRCATVAFGSTRDLAAVQALLGHARPDTTLGYIRLPDDAVRAAVAAAAA